MTQIQLTPSAKKSAFLLKTYEILQNSVYASIVTWHHDDVGFVIGDVQKFTSQILPAFFKHSNFASFIRQLNMYGFSKKRSVRGQNYYYHSKFRRNEKQMISQIYRKVQKKSNNNKRINESKMQPVSQHKISSQLSIQLQCKQQHSQKVNNNKLSHFQQLKYDKLCQLLKANQSLLQIQTNSLYSVLADISSLHLSIGNRKYDNEHEHDNNIQENCDYQSSQDYSQNMSKILVEYIETHRVFLQLINQKLRNSQQKSQIQHHNQRQQQQHKNSVQLVIPVNDNIHNSATSMQDSVARVSLMAASNTNHKINNMECVKTEQTLKSSNNNIGSNTNNVNIGMDGRLSLENTGIQQGKSDRKRKVQRVDNYANNK